MESDWVDFKEIKRAVSLEMVLAHYNVQLRRVNRESLRGACPLPTHSSKGEQNFCVNVAKNIWSCQSSSCVKTRLGKKGGNVLDFAAAMEGCSIRDAALKLSKWFSGQSNKGHASPQRNAQTTSGTATHVLADQKGDGEVSNTRDSNPGVENKPLAFTLKIDRTPHPYLAARGITPETASHFGVGFFSGKGSMHDRIVIPIYNTANELIAYVGRSIERQNRSTNYHPVFTNHKNSLTSHESSCRQIRASAVWWWSKDFLIA